MIAQQELQDVFKLPVADRLRLAQRLIESALQETEPPPTIITTRDVESSNGTPPEEVASAPPPSVQWLLQMAGRYSGGPGNTAARADEICEAEIDKRAGFTTKY